MEKSIQELKEAYVAERAKWAEEKMILEARVRGSIKADLNKMFFELFVLARGINDSTTLSAAEALNFEGHIEAIYDEFDKLGLLDKYSRYEFDHEDHRKERDEQNCEQGGEH